MAESLDQLRADVEEARYQMISFEMLGFKGYAYHVAANTYRKALGALAGAAA